MFMRLFAAPLHQWNELRGVLSATCDGTPNSLKMYITGPDALLGNLGVFVEGRGGWST